VAQAGAALSGRGVTAVTPAKDRFVVTLDNEASDIADYLILAEGRNPEIAASLGVATDDSGGTVVDAEQRTSVPRVYAAGRVTRPSRSQAIISAGAGAIAALDILAMIAGADVTDWDSVG